MPDPALMLPLAHISDWYHAVLYLAPVIAVIVAIVVTVVRSRNLPPPEPDPEADADDEPPQD